MTGLEPGGGGFGGVGSAAGGFGGGGVRRREGSAAPPGPAAPGDPRFPGHPPLRWTALGTEPQGAGTACPTVSSVAASLATSGSGDTDGDQAKNTSVRPMRRSTNRASRGYWTAPVPDAR